MRISCQTFSKISLSMSKNMAAKKLFPMIFFLIQDTLNQEQTWNNDFWEAYDSLGKVGYNHLKIQKSLNFTHPIK